jgi:hypothetical protein
VSLRGSRPPSASSALWPTRKRLVTLPRRASRSVCLGESARRRETPDVVYVHPAPFFRIGLGATEFGSPLRGGLRTHPNPVRTPVDSCDLVKDAHGRGRSSSPTNYLDPCEPLQLARMSERQVVSTSATRIFSFQRREPTSCVASVEFCEHFPFGKHSPHAALIRPSCGGRNASGSTQRIIGFGDIAKGEAYSASRPRNMLTVCRTVTNSPRRSLRALGSKEPLV